jgi:phosphohistidine phosphatase SixA
MARSPTLPPAPTRRRLLLALAAGAATPAAARPAAAQADPLERLRAGGLAFILRHARTEPGTGDPPGFRLDDCSTQRNLSAAGREQARAVGEALRAARVPVGRVLSSRWCRCLETARLLGLGQVEPFPPVDSFFADRSRRTAQTEAVREFLRGWRGPGNVVMVTHQVNVTALTGVFPASGEAVVVAPPDAAVLGRLTLG